MSRIRRVISKLDKELIHGRKPDKSKSRRCGSFLPPEWRWRKPALILFEIFNNIACTDYNLCRTLNKKEEKHEKK